MKICRGVKGAIVIAVTAMLLVAFSSCNGGTTPSEVTAPPTQFIVPPTLSFPASETTTTVPPTISENQDSTTTTLPSTQPTQSTTTTAPTTATNTAAPPTATTPQLPRELRTKTGIVKYFNDALNGGKKDAKRAYRTLERVNILNLTFADALDLTDNLAASWNKNNTRRLPIARRDIPVRGENFGGRLGIEGVDSASCEIDGDDYLITIALKPESGAIYQDNSYHGQVFKLTGKSGESDSWEQLNSFLEEISKEIDNAVVTFIRKRFFQADTSPALDFSFNYSQGVVVCRVERKSGRLQSSQYAIRQQITASSGRLRWLAYDVIQEDGYAFEW